MLKYKLAKIEKRLKTKTGRPFKAKDDFLIVEAVKTPHQIEREKLAAEIKTLERRERELKRQLKSPSTERHLEA